MNGPKVFSHHGLISLDRIYLGCTFDSYVFHISRPYSCLISYQSRFGGNTKEDRDCRMPPSTLGGTLWFIVNTVLKTSRNQLRSSETLCSLFPYADIQSRAPFSLYFSPPKNLPLLRVSNEAVPWWSRWEAGRNKADLASAWAAALVLFQMKNQLWKAALQNL